MAYDVKATLGQIAGWLSASGFGKNVVIGEPKAPAEDDLTVAVFMSSVTPVKFFLDGGTEELHLVQVRLYRNMLADAEDTEIKLAEALNGMTTKLLTDFQLDGNIRDIDAAGEFGQPMTATWGYADINGLMYRIVDLLVPLVVDDRVTAAA